MFKAIGGFFKKAWVNVLAPVVKGVVVPTAKEVAEDYFKNKVQELEDKIDKKVDKE